MNFIAGVHYEGTGGAGRGRSSYHGEAMWRGGKDGYCGAEVFSLTWSIGDEVRLVVVVVESERGWVEMVDEEDVRNQRKVIVVVKSETRGGGRGRGGDDSVCGE